MVPVMRAAMMLAASSRPDTPAMVPVGLDPATIGRGGLTRADARQTGGRASISHAFLGRRGEAKLAGEYPLPPGHPGRVTPSASARRGGTATARAAVRPCLTESSDAYAPAGR